MEELLSMLLLPCLLVRRLPTASKLFGRILIDRLITEVDEKLRAEQKKRATVQLNESSLSLNRMQDGKASFYVKFVDVQKNFLLLLTILLEK